MYVTQDKPQPWPQATCMDDKIVRGWFFTDINTRKKNRRIFVSLGDPMIKQTCECQAGDTVPPGGPTVGVEVRGASLLGGHGDGKGRLHTPPGHVACPTENRCVCHPQLLI